MTVLALGLATQVANSADSRGEYEVKAAFMLNFARLSEWPEKSAPSGDEPFVICVAGSRVAHDAIAAGAHEAMVHDRTVQVRRSRNLDDTAGCQIQFVSHDIGIPDRAQLQSLLGAGILSVGERDGFAEGGGVINFFPKQKKIRFAINREAAKEAGIRISSRLLRLAKLVSSGD